ncbi:transcriptional repressor [Burkholderia mayonis]|uniref:Fur family transcriptional regulator n=1 Tax=Burkholderia mayonis TaxID=1385591 RepID=UPI0009EC951A
MSTFLERGLVTSASLGDSRVVYELNRGKDHHHLVCRKCGALCDLYEDELNEQFERIASGRRFKFHAASLVIAGVCPECQAKGV